MKLSKQQILGIAFAFGFLIFIFAICLKNAPTPQERQQKNGTDAAALRSVVAEAFIKTSTDPDFVNTATEDQPMEIPEKYYTYVESVQGDGPVHVIMYADGDVSAYFGTPEKTIHYYLQ